MKPPERTLRQRIGESAYLFRALYLLLAIVPLLMALFAYTLSARLLSQEAVELQRHRIEKVASELDGIFLQTEVLAQQTLFRHDILRVAAFRRPLNVDAHFRIGEAVRELSPYSNTLDQDISGFYVFFPGLDYVITPEAAYDAEFYFSRANNYVGLDTPGELLAFHREAITTRDLKVVQVVSREAFRARHIAIVRPIGQATGRELYLVVLMSLDGVISRLASVSDNDKLAVVSSSGEVIASAGCSRCEFPPHSEIPADGAPWHASVAGQTHVIYSINSEFGNFRYLSAIPMEVFREKVNLVRNILFPLGIAMLLLSTVAAYFWSSPLSGLVWDLSDRFTIGPANRIVRGPREEIGSIRSRLNQAFMNSEELEEQNRKLVLENESARRRIGENFQLVRNGLLQKLLQDGSNSTDIVSVLRRSYGIRFDYRWFALMLAIPDHAKPVSAGDAETNDDLGLLLLSLVSETDFGRDVEKHFVRIGKEECAVILNFGDYEGNRSPWLSSTASRVQSFLENHSGRSATLCVSAVHERADSLEMCMIEARSASAYRVIRGHGSVIHFGEIVGAHKEYYYPIDAELKIINSVRAGTFSTCKEVIQEVFAHNFETGTQRSELTTCLFYDMTSTAMKILDSIHLPVDLVFPEADPLEQLMYCETSDQMRTVLLGIYEEACDHVSANHETNECNAAIRMKLYLDEHYSDALFSQTQVADQMGVSASYVSLLFKKHYGINMHEYVLQRRLEKAAELLADPTLLVSEAATQVGYSSDKTFIRVFKKYRGVTPGQFRKSLASRQADSAIDDRA